MERINWLEMWCDDKESIIQTMIKNMQADYEAGYDWFGHSLTKQRAELEAYKAEYDEQYQMLMNMEDDKHLQRWCHMDLKRRGAIA